MGYRPARGATALPHPIRDSTGSSVFSRDRGRLEGDGRFQTTDRISRLAAHIRGDQEQRNGAARDLEVTLARVLTNARAALHPSCRNLSVVIPAALSSSTSSLPGSDPAIHRGLV